MKNKNLYLKLFAVFSFLTGLVYCFFAINVTKKLSKNDIKSIKHLNIDNYCQELNSFEKEIKCIKKIQNKQLSIVKSKDCRKNFVQAGGLEFIKSNRACCFDRSRFMEQSFKYYGFKTRHVFLIESKPYLISEAGDINENSPCVCELCNRPHFSLVFDKSTADKRL